jgi:hypothetical protein
MKKLIPIILCFVLGSCKYIEYSKKCDSYTDSASKYLELYVSSTGTMTHYVLMETRATSSEVDNFGDHKKVTEYYNLGMRYADTFHMYKVINQRYHDEVYRYVDSAKKYDSLK